MKKQFIYILSTIIVIILATGTVAWPHGGEDHTGASLASTGGTALGETIRVPKKTQFLLEILTARAVKKSVPRLHKALGRVVLQPKGRAEVHSPFEGLLVSRRKFSLPSPGQRVKKGEVVAYVEQVVNVSETISLVTEITSLESEKKQVEEELNLAKLEVKRVKELGDAVSRKHVAEAHADAAVARKKLEGLINTLQKLRATQSNSKNNPRIVPIKAPINGVIATSSATIGEFVRPEKMIFEILDITRVWIQADVFEMDLSLVEDADRAEIISEAYPTQSFAGKLHYIGQKLSSQSRTVKAYFKVANPAGQLREGMFVRILIETKTRETGVMFPKSAVVNEAGQKVVYVKASPETFIAKPVELKGTWGDQVMVSSGVEPGEIVVIQGTYQVRTSALKK